ncbi:MULTISPECIES: response regulator transcription factor [Bacillus cereus group]|uniref:response regulator transcription factor n=1 Tax=Bacillus cereus group TaxID=86661 RepID=UPI000472447A|nr:MULTISPECIES: response regulator transcription factor [Bacillus cereus group]MDA2440871.1 response regulator transcription factor [Bacillus cereus]MDA2445345.1 response regulator transcription factor [Bacillus cereus]MDA2705068.1 response regulator transcription factor [Bacillus cereus]MDA2710735.1 response regulator transcription factor [Bacillus cereus]NIL31986.1 response regulator transcription factor [Bacillus thuringiensis]
MKKNILIVDDDKDIIDLLKLFLEMENFFVVEASNGEVALKCLEENHIDLAIVDIMMPKMDGYQLIKKIRETLQFPILILSAKSQEVDKIIGLGIGADDFITKPFSALEIIARVQAHLRRSYEFNDKAVEGKEKQIHMGDLVLDHHSCTLYKSSETITLSATEYKILTLFMEEPGRIFTKKQIFESVWSDYYCADDNTIMVHISRLREKLEDSPKNPVYIKTIRGLGYRFARKEELYEK